MRRRGIRTQYLENPPSPLYDARFTRIGGISTATSAAMAEELAGVASSTTPASWTPMPTPSPRRSSPTRRASRPSPRRRGPVCSRASSRRCGPSTACSPTPPSARSPSSRTAPPSRSEPPASCQAAADTATAQRTPLMEIAYTPAQAALRNELRAYYDEILDDETIREVRADSVGPTAERVWKQMCADGWVGLGWPTEFGGRDLDPFDQFIFFDESMRVALRCRSHGQHRRARRSCNFGTDGTEGEASSPDPRRRPPLRHRVLRAGGRHRPGRRCGRAVRDGDE